MRTKERGATAVAVAVVLAALFGFLALSLDIGHALSVRGELQNGADAGALAGAMRLSGRNLNYELAGAESDARNYARSHPTDTYRVEPRPGAAGIQLGAWVPEGDPCPDSASGVLVTKYGYKFCEIQDRTDAAAADITAVRVVTSREGDPGAVSGGGAVALAFGGIVHSGPAPVVAEAIALAGGPASAACPDLPVAVRAGCLYRGGTLICDANGFGHVYYVGLSSATEDTAGLTSLSEESANKDRICDIVRRPPGCNMPLRDGVDIRIQEGTSYSGNCADGCSSRDYHGIPTTNDTICEMIRKKADTDCDGAIDIGPDGKPGYRTHIPVVQYPGESLDSCQPGDHWNQSAEVVGWATVAIVSVRCEGIGPHQNELPMAPASGALPITALCDAYMQSYGLFSTGSCIAIQLFCDEEAREETAVGGGWFGTAPLQPVLVR